MHHYERKFETITQLDEYVEAQKEAGREFHFDRVTKRAWIDVDVDEHRRLSEEDTYGG